MPAANITGHYMAIGKRVLITSKSTHALNVITEKIAGSVVGEELKHLIISWSDQQRVEKLDAALELLAELAHRDPGRTEHDERCAGLKKDVSEYEKVIAHYENSFSSKSEMSSKSLKEIADSPDFEFHGLANAIKNMSNSDQDFYLVGLRIMDKKPVELAEVVSQELKSDEASTFATFMDESVRKALSSQTATKELSDWIASEGACTLRCRVEKCKEDISPSNDSSLGDLSCDFWI